ncbi:MAG: cardiolipin synthase ClsB [Betaproteobacteria bacterium]|nr:cardiolipin synthase ClsB [Betaproteobacteria bacterium]
MKNLPIVAGNRLVLLKNGMEFFPALEAAIAEAQQEIRIETYIFQNDATGTRIANALIDAAWRGVRVFVLVDGVGSRLTPLSFFKRLRDAGVTVLVYRPELQFFNLNKSRFRRVHRKIILVDGRLGFVGGINLIDDMTDSLSTHPRYDYAVQIEGPLLKHIYAAVLRLWRPVAWWHFGHRRQDDEPLSVGTTPIGRMRARFVARDNLRHRRDIENAYLQAIRQAKAEIIIVNAYFLPGRRLRQALMAAARRGVTVTLLLQGRADHPLLQMATRALYAQLLGAGVAIYEYQKSMLHSKVAVIDRRWATVGSSNLDPFSLLLNREANVIVLEPAFAKKLRASIMKEISSGAVKHHPDGWQNRSTCQRAQSWLAYSFARMVAGWIGVRSD